MKPSSSSWRTASRLALIFVLAVLASWWMDSAGRDAPAGQLRSPLGPANSPLYRPKPSTHMPAPTRIANPTRPRTVTRTASPDPKLLLTPVVTPIPLASPPFIPGLAGKSTEPYRVAFRKENTLWIMNNDGSDLKMILDSESQMSLYLGHNPYPERVIKWASPSPDGRTLALVFSDVFEFEHQGQEAHFSIYNFDVDTEELDFLVEGVDPEWSPDGSQIAYRDSTGGLSVVDVATKTVRKAFSAEPGGYIVWDFTWSPDGDRIAFVHKIRGLGGTPEILVTALDGQDRVISLFPDTIFETGNQSWSPKGEDILFVSSAGEHSGPQLSRNLWRATANGARQLQLTKDIVVTSNNPLWSSNGDWIVFVGSQEYALPESIFSTWLLSADGSQLYRLTTGTVTDARWSPDGTQIIYQKEEQGIWTLDLRDGFERQIYPGEPGVTYLDMAVLPGS